MSSTVTIEPSGPSHQALRILALLKERHNVLVSGPPASGKSRVLAEVAHWFGSRGQPGYDPYGPIVLPNTATPRSIEGSFPSADRKNRQVFSTAFHQGTKYRDFIRGLVPRIATGSEGGSGFVVSSGILYRAAEFARAGGAALLVIDEINRGPAVQVFGDSIVAMEHSKRLGPDGLPRAETHFFEVMDDSGAMKNFALPNDLYLLAAMNQADTSVEPLDVAFLRRWEPFALEPDEIGLLRYFRIDSADPEPPENCRDQQDLFRAAVRAWRSINASIALGRGREFRIGHGVFMETDPFEVSSLAHASALVERAWRRIRAHVDEVFFGDVRAAAETLNVRGGVDHPYSLRESFFATAPVVELEGDPYPSGGELYRLLRAVGRTS